LDGDDRDVPDIEQVLAGGAKVLASLPGACISEYFICRKPADVRGWIIEKFKVSINSPRRQSENSE
jgi:hypothetical protein